MELKPCPFCGGEADYAYLKKRFSLVFGFYYPAYIRCKGCRATSQVAVQMKDAVEAWNRRVNDE